MSPRPNVTMVLSIIFGFGLFISPADADVITIDLKTPVDFVTTGGRLSALPGPYGEVRVDLTSPTTALITFTSIVEGPVTGPNIYLFGGAVGVNPHANNFSVTNIIASNSGVGFLPAVSNIQVVDGDIGPLSFFKARIDFFPFEAGVFEHTMDSVSFTLTNLADSWTNAADVLGPRPVDPTGFMAAALIFVTPFPANAANGEILEGVAYSDQLPIPTANPHTFLLGSAGLALSLLLRRRWV